MDDGLLNASHVLQSCALQEEGLHAVAVELDGFGPQVKGPRVTLAVKTVAADKTETHNMIGKRVTDIVLREED